jgi:hypothetical protein
MAVAKLKDPETKAETLRDAAKAALLQAGGDVRRATDALAARAMDEPEFLKAHYAEIIRTASYDAVSGAIRAERAIVWNTPQPTTIERRAQVTALASGTVRTLLDFPLPGGKRLGDATRGEVGEAADLYGSQARDMAWKARWLAHVAQSVPDGKRVADVLTAERLEELRQEIGQ